MFQRLLKKWLHLNFKFYLRKPINIYFSIVIFIIVDIVKENQYFDWNSIHTHVTIV